MSLLNGDSRGETKIVKPDLLKDLMDEASQLVAIFVSSINKAKGND